jgi:hypothetical protein
MAIPLISRDADTLAANYRSVGSRLNAVHSMAALRSPEGGQVSRITLDLPHPTPESAGWKQANPKPEIDSPFAIF